MTENNALFLCIDLKKNRVRVYREIVHMLGNPPFIQLLINPEERMAAIRPADVAVAGGEYYDVSRMSKCIEFYSKSFLGELKGLDNRLKSDCSYRMQGYAINRTAVIFPFDCITPIDAME